MRSDVVTGIGGPGFQFRGDVGFVPEIFSK